MAYSGSDIYYEESGSDTTVPVRFKQKAKKNSLEERVREYTGYLQVNLALYSRAVEPDHVYSHHRYLMSRLSLQVFYL
jgi:hypothetical protein